MSWLAVVPRDGSLSIPDQGELTQTFYCREFISQSRPSYFISPDLQRPSLDKAPPLPPPHLPFPAMDHASKLPAELITYILELAPDSVTPTPRPWRNRNALLARLALVCRNWRHPAQEILWRQVEIRSNKGARAFVAASGGGRRTLQLRDVVGTKVGAMERDAVIKACVGLKEVELRGGPDSFEGTLRAEHGW